MDTSVAARPSKTHAETVREDVLQVFRHCAAGCTTHEVAAALDLPVSTVQPRVSELKAAGKIVDAKIRRENPTSGKKAAVFRIPPPPGPAVQLSLFGGAMHA